MATVSILSSSWTAVARRERIIHALTTLARITFLYRVSRFVLLGGYRHVRARGVLRSLIDIYASLRNVSLPVGISLQFDPSPSPSSASSYLCLHPKRRSIRN